MKKYILQNDCFSCALIALLNFCIEKRGASPIRYGSLQFLKLFKACGGTYKSGIRYFEPALEYLKIGKKDSPKYKSLARFKKFIIKQLKLGHSIWFSYYNDNNTFHAVLLVKYDEESLLFKTINGTIHRRDNPIEYLTWEDLTMNLFVYEKKKVEQEFYNDVEECMMATKNVIYDACVLFDENENIKNQKK